MLSNKIFLEFLCYFIGLNLVTIMSAGDVPAECGVRKNWKTELILNAHNTERGEWPWHAAVYHRPHTKGNLPDSYVCGGTLISEQFVLTAAHCVLDSANRQELAYERIIVRMGVHDLSAKTFQQITVSKVYKPENFTGNDFRHDIAILKLKTLAVFNDFVQPACLHPSDNLTGQYGSVIGWGVTEAKNKSSVLKCARIPVIDTISCLASDRKLFGETLHHGIFCAGYTNGTGVCNGDSGGGLFFEGGNSWFLGGIVSYSRLRDGGSNLCHTHSYAAFTKVHTYLPWISTITKVKIPDIKEYIRPSCKSKDVDPSQNYTDNLLPIDCGSYVRNRIIRGNKTRVFEFPWMALIEYRQLYCVGTLINTRYVLTNVACAQVDDEFIAVRLGEHTIDQEEDCSTTDDETECAPSVEKYGIECRITHNNYNNRSHLNDIALIRLDRDVVIRIHIKPICLPVTNRLRESLLQKYIITGWGRSEQGMWSNELRQGTVTPAEPSVCQEWLDKEGLKLHQSQLCVGQSNGSDACLGDGGGPLGNSARYKGMRFVQFGIISYGSHNCHGLSIYTNVSYFMNWILANIKL